MKNKKGNVIGIMGLLLAVAFLSVIGMTLYIINFGVTNDYLFYEMQGISEDLALRGTVTEETSALTLSIFQSYQNVILYGDDYWFAFYFIFVVGTVILAYRVRGLSEVRFFLFLFYGILVLMFVVGLVETFTSWFSSQIMANMIPGALGYFPKFNWYLDNIGIVSMIHSVVLLVVSRLDFNFATKKSLEDREMQSLADNEEVF